jgi:hypothetical protein
VFAEPSTPSAEVILEVIRTGQLPDVVAGLFPAGPTSEDLLTDSDTTRFMSRWRRARLDAPQPEDTLEPLLGVGRDA